jgi:hypothetical protein
MWASLSAIFAGNAGSHWLHLLLVAASVLAASIFGAGMILRSAENALRLRRYAIWFVVVGMALQSCALIALFAVDEHVSLAQNDKIIDLETRLAPRSLTPEQQQRIAEKLKPFAGVPFDFTVAPAQEPIVLEDQIKEALENAGWKFSPYFLGTVKVAYSRLGFVGLTAEVPHEKLGEWGPALHALGDAMAAEGLQMAARVAVDDQVPTNAIHVIIGTKG